MASWQVDTYIDRDAICTTTFVSQCHHVAHCPHTVVCVCSSSVHTPAGPPCKSLTASKPCKLHSVSAKSSGFLFRHTVYSVADHFALHTKTQLNSTQLPRRLFFLCSSRLCLCTCASCTTIHSRYASPKGAGTSGRPWNPKELLKAFPIHRHSPTLVHVDLHLQSTSLFFSPPP